MPLGSGHFWSAFGRCGRTPQGLALFFASREWNRRSGHMAFCRRFIREHEGHSLGEGAYRPVIAVTM
jgi:hypothetical protein